MGKYLNNKKYIIRAKGGNKLSDVSQALVDEYNREQEALNKHMYIMDEDGNLVRNPNWRNNQALSGYDPIMGDIVVGAALGKPLSYIGGKMFKGAKNVYDKVMPYTADETMNAVANKTKNGAKEIYQYLKNYFTKSEIEIPDYITNKLDFDKVYQSQWYKDLVNEFGQKRADYIVKNIQKDDFKKFFMEEVAGFSPDKEMAAYNKSREIFFKLAGDPEKGKGLLGGSAGIMNEGTITRPSAAPHDLDFRAYIGNASKSAPKLENTYTYEDLSPLFNNENLKNSPILQILREQFPDKFSDLSIINFNNKLPRWFVPRNKSNQVYVTPMINQGTPGASRTLMTEIDGVPIDFFITDNKLIGKKISSARETLYWKDLWNRRRGTPRAKDVKDIEDFVPFSKDNPVIDVSGNTSQYAPFHFGDDIISKEGFPMIHKVETYPGSKNFVPAIMNWRGTFKSPTTSNWLGRNFYKEGGKINIDRE